MASHFCLSVHLLDTTFHGRRKSGDPEWPPSPLRAFQALVAAAAARSRGAGIVGRASMALQWLERQSAPVILAPAGVTASGYRLSVPNNTLDIVATAWSRGTSSDSGDTNPATHRTMKSVRPTLLLGSESIRYLWPLADPLGEDAHDHAEVLAGIAHSIVSLGWGIDLAVGSCAVLSHEQVATLQGERWLPRISVMDEGLRVPVPGSLDDVVHRHESFVKRLGDDGLTPPIPLSVYIRVEYHRDSDPLPRHVAAFSLLTLDATGFRAFDTPRRTLAVAGMVRYGAKLAAGCAGWSRQKINEFVLGHGEPGESGRHIPVGPRRFAYLPLPSIEGRGEGKPRVVGSIRRVLLSCPADDCMEEIAWARRALAGQELIEENMKEPVALLSVLPTTERLIRFYTRPSAAWATVTPVVLPGYDDPDHLRRRLKGVTALEQKRLLERLDDRIDALLRKAIAQAGFSQVLADHAELEWRKGGFWPGVDLAERYTVPEHVMRFPRLHVRITWRDQQGKPVSVPGPVCLGSGRFYGIGLFAAL